MEPDVIRMYSSTPPPMEDGAEEEDDEFGDFGTFSGIPNSISFTEFDTPTTFNQTQALTATSPPELINNRRVAGFGHGSSNGTRGPGNELSKANGVVATGRLGGSPSERTETKKVLSAPLDFSVSDTASGKLADCNGGGAEVLTNGFATFDVQGSPSSQNSVHSHIKGMSTEDTGGIPICSPEDDFADFAAFSNAEGHVSQTVKGDSDSSTGAALHDEHCNKEQGTTSEDNVRDTNGTGPDTCGSDSLSAPAEASDGSCTDNDSRQRDVAFARQRSASEAVCTNEPLSLNGGGVADRDESKDDAGGGESDRSPDTAADGEVGQLDEKGSGNETETETETSLGRPLSTDALEEYGDVSTTGSVPSPSPQGDTSTPADQSQLAEDDEDFGDFGDASVACAFGGQGFADFEPSCATCLAPAQAATNAEEDDDFGDFNSPKFHGGGSEGRDGDEFVDFPVSNSFGNFSSAVEGAGGEADVGWSAFGEQQQVEGESWAAFSTEQSVFAPAGSREEEVEEEVEEEDEVEDEVEVEEEVDKLEEWHESEAPAVGEETSRTDRQRVLLSSRLERLFQSSFPRTANPPMEDEVVSLKILLGPPGDQQGPGGKQDSRLPCNRSARGGVWTQLQDIHEALGLRYQWGGSHCNKALLCCLGIDTRNILFTGQKKQPVIVPMYAASLGMLEPTKEPVKPVSAAEMIASIAQAPPGALEQSACPSDPAQQEALPPVQFDWSSSGLTNPLDASGGSSLLNLDFFGPVEDSGSTSSPSIPGVDPELYELTTAKLDPSSSGSRVADAFARLMSTMEKTSTSTRRPRKDENLSEEAAKVIAALPDLSFMQAKVLMFPATLTPLGSQATSD